MSKNTVIKIVSIVACALLVAGIVLLVCLLPRGGKTQQIELQLFTAESAENITASTQQGSVKFLNSSGEEISSTLNETTYSLTANQGEKITLNFNANNGYGFAGLYSTPDFETNSLITNNPSYELNTENQPTKLFAKFGKLENLTLEIQTTEQGATEQISKTFPITICLTQEEILPIIEENFPTAKSLYIAENKCIGMTETDNPSKTFAFNSSTSIIKIQPADIDIVGANVSVTINPTGGIYNSQTENSTITGEGSQIATLGIPTKTGYEFLGWTVASKNTNTISMPGTLNTLGYAMSNNAAINNGNKPDAFAVYNNKNNGTVTHTVINDETNPIGTGKSIMIKTNGTADPNAGGFYQNIQSGANLTFYQLIVAKIPQGYTLLSAKNACGNNATDCWYDFELKEWKTDSISNECQKGTGHWRVYLYRLICGSSGTFSTAGHKHLSGTSNTNVTWYVGYSQIYRVNSGTSTSVVSGLPYDTSTSYTFGTANNTVYALWKEAVHTITLNNQSATSEGTTTIYEWQEFGYYIDLYHMNLMTTNENAITVPTKTNYVFGGYYTEINGGGTQYIDANGKLTSSASNTKFSDNGTLYAKWIFAITLDKQGATTAGTTTIYGVYNNGYYLNADGINQKMSTSANPITVPAKTNYIFGGYYTAINGGGTQYIDASGKLTSSASITNFSAAGTLYAKWIFTISLDNQSATIIGTTKIYGIYDNGYYLNVDGINQKMSTSANGITVPTRTGCFFRGYYTEELGAGTQCINASGNITASNTYFDKNTTLYAKWDYTITLDGQLPTTAGTTKIYETYNTGYYLNSACTTQMSTTANKIDIPTKAGEIFGGYYTEINGNGTQYIDRRGFLTTGASTTNFTAIGSLYAYWIHLAGGLGTLANPYLISTAEHLNNLTNHVDDGNSCAGQYFKVTADIGTEVSPISWTLPIGTTADKPFAGSFDGNGYKITYKYGSSSYQYAGLFGYYSGPTIKNLSIGGTMNNSKADGYGGAIVGYASSALTLTNCFNTGSVNAISYAGSLIGYANSTLTVTNCYNTGSVVSLTNAGGIVGYGNSTTSITNCYNSGQVFKGATTRGSGIICSSAAIQNGFYLKNACADSLGRSFDGSSEVGYILEKLNLYVIANSSAGYKYWKVIAGQNDNFPVFSNNPTTYTVTFNVNGGKGGPDQATYTHYTVFDVPDVAPMKDGCAFVCWNDSANGTGINYYPNHSYILTSNKTLYAVYVESGGGGDVTIQLCANGGEFVNAQEQTIKSRDVGGIVTLERPTRNGFRFLGYNTKADGSGTDITTMKVSEDISLFAQWEPMEYYVKYYDGSTLLKTDTIPANQQKALSSWTAMKTGQTTAEANGWVFHGWATNNSSFERAYENLAIIENITTFGETINLYAIYSKVLTVNYNGNGATSGSVEEDKSQTVYLSASKTMSNYSVTLKANEFAKTNYHFSKWAFGSATGTQFDVGDSFTQANSSLIWNNDSTFTKTFYAVWAGNGYTINYYNGTTKAGTENYIYGENSTLKTFASLDQTIANQLYGWKFSGWAIANNSITKTFNDGANITNINIGSEITQGLTIDLYAIYERTIAFHSGKNCATNSTATQTWNPYSTNASNISSVEAPVPTSLKEENWITLGYRADQSAGLATYAVQTAKTITPAVDTLNDLYAVYSKEVTITLADKTTTTTTYYNTSGDQTEITTIS